MPVTGASTLGQIEQAYPSARLVLFLRHRVEKFEPEQPLASVLAALGHADPEAVLEEIYSVHRALEKDYADGKMEVWRAPLNRFLRQYCVEVALLSSSFTRATNEGVDPLLVASQVAVLKHGGAPAVDAAYTIRSQRERLSFERWLEGERRGRRLSTVEEMHVVERWQSQHAGPHKDWLLLQLEFFLRMEWERFFKQIFAEGATA
ncbi:MAG: hypothetical protein HYZ53_30875 [Planctomycetes bacterium]|nr:hypothetical protein [Planctomycetota bacterium]